MGGSRAHRPRLRSTGFGSQNHLIAGPAVTETDLPLKLFSRGKVRDTYELGADRLLMVATDRISAFDHVLPNGIPDRGKVLTQLSIYWFSQTHSFQENHLVSGMVPDLPAALQDRRGDLAGRFMIVRKAKRIDFECVVRGYLAGSAWKEYQDSHTLAGEEMPPGLRESERLAYPTFSPATKAASGHDENITFDDLVLIDEALTPDSSRYWEAATYQIGTSPQSYDKQFVRDWLTRSGWDKESDPPRLPDDIVAQTRERYLTAYHRLVGKPLFPPKARNE